MHPRAPSLERTERRRVTGHGLQDGRGELVARLLFHEVAPGVEARAHAHMLARLVGDDEGKRHVVKVLRFFERFAAHGLGEKSPPQAVDRRFDCGRAEPDCSCIMHVSGARMEVSDDPEIGSDHDSEWGKKLPNLVQNDVRACDPRVSCQRALARSAASSCAVTKAP